MKITRIKSSFWDSPAEIMVDGLDNEKVLRAYEDPRIKNLARANKLEVSNPNGLVFYKGSNAVCGIKSMSGYIFFSKEYQQLIEEATKLVLGESLNEAVLEFMNSKKNSQQA